MTGEMSTSRKSVIDRAAANLRAHTIVETWVGTLRGLDGSSRPCSTQRVEDGA